MWRRHLCSLKKSAYIIDRGVFLDLSSIFQKYPYGHQLTKKIRIDDPESNVPFLEIFLSRRRRNQDSKEDVAEQFSSSRLRCMKHVLTHHGRNPFNVLSDMRSLRTSREFRVFKTSSAFLETSTPLKDLRLR
ncbi:hypothetical protein TNCV_3901701 [Trichonephila clavipes]|nr:hypothetical protein TNCV_3901701 [Trichonephila clavipes]